MATRHIEQVDAETGEILQGSAIVEIDIDIH